MNNFIFQNDTEVYFGRGCVKEYLSCLVRPWFTIMLAYGGGSVKANGIYDEVADILREAGKNIVEFPGIMTNPTYEKVMEGARIARENKVDMILALGGGSVMDCCKAIALAAKYEGDIWEDFWIRLGVINVEPLPVGAIVTVAGTGSECNGAAVITNEEQKIKTGRDYQKLNPRFALMDPVYTYTVPRDQMVAGGFDILSHIMETYFSEPDDDNVSDDIMEALMRSVIRNIRMAIKDPTDYIARSNLMWASTMAENRVIKMGKKCDFECHNMGYQLSVYTGCSHGFSMAVLHPVYYRHIFRDGLGKFVRFAKNVWELVPKDQSDEVFALEGIKALEKFIREIGLPATIKELGMTDKGALREIADSCILSGGGYKKMSHDEIYRIFNECFGI